MPNNRIYMSEVTLERVQVQVAVCRILLKYYRSITYKYLVVAIILSSINAKTKLRNSPLSLLKDPRSRKTRKTRVLGSLCILRVKTCKLRVTCKMRNPHKEIYGFTRNNA